MLRSIWITLSLLLAGTACLADTVDATHPAAKVVAAFNQAVSAGDIDKAVGMLADGSVQFQLHPAHQNTGQEQTLTMDYAATWKMVGAILLPTTDDYSREVRITSVHADGELAVVWTDTRTQSKPKDKPVNPAKEFSEVWLLINKDGSGWRIAGNASNRPTDAMNLGAGS